MFAVDFLIAPLRLFLVALGTGRLPGTDPVSALTTLVGDLETIRTDTQRADTRVGPQWLGAGGDGAQQLARATAAENASITDDGAQILALTTTAAGRVEVAAQQLTALLDSFERTARAIAPTTPIPAAIATLVPVAVDHVGRGVAIIERTRAELAADATRLAAIGAHETPLPVELAGGAPGPANGAKPVDGKGVAITLPDGSVVHAPNERAAGAVRAALSQQGVPYVWGGTTPAGFDCSGFTQWAYKQAGVDIPRLAQDQDTAGVAVSQNNLLPGDLAVWDGHVAMVIGNGQMIEAGDPVQISAVRTTNAGQGFQGFYRPR